MIDSLTLQRCPCTGPRVDDLAAVLAGARADVDDPVGDSRIVSSSCSTTSTVLPRSRSRIERVDQPAVVALVQADRRLVEHVQHADQAGADLDWPAGCAAPRRRPACPPSATA